MPKKKARWEPEIVSGMTEGQIVDKLKKLLPGFDTGSFVATTAKYISCEDLCEEEYYPRAKFSDEDEDFIWIACEELWKRLVAERPALEHVAEQVDTLAEKILKAAQKQRLKAVYRLTQEALEFLLSHVFEVTPAGTRLRSDLYKKLGEMTFYDMDNFVGDMMRTLIQHEEYERVVDIAGALGEGLNDDVFLDYKAEGLFGLGRKDEGEKLLQELISRHPRVYWFPLHLADCLIDYGEGDFSKAKGLYLKALGIAQKYYRERHDKEELRQVYERLIDLASDTGDRDSGERYQHLVTLLDARKVGRNDPCPCGSGKKYKHCCGREAAPAPLPAFDRRTMEPGLLAIKQQVDSHKFSSIEEMNSYFDNMNKGGKLPQWVPQTPLEEAQSLIYRAVESEGKERMKLVEQALRISPDCADAYVMLAEEKAQSIEESLRYYQAGVEAGERALGKKFFEEFAGHFWGEVETRPYMRARLGLAQCLWALERQEEAIGHYRELLRLNPNDNQGVRYLLAAGLLERGEIDSLQELLGKYDEPTADWLYTKALLAYIKQGDGARSRRLLKEAVKHNAHTVAYLLGEKKLPRLLPENITLGEEDEAMVYADSFGAGWRQAKGALDWLESIARGKSATGKGLKKTSGIPEVFLQAFEAENKKGHPKKKSGD